MKKQQDWHFFLFWKKEEKEKMDGVKNGWGVSLFKLLGGGHEFCDHTIAGS